jgi:DNA-directed RNA polymerase subunit beta'
MANINQIKFTTTEGFDSGKNLKTSLSLENDKGLATKSANKIFFNTCFDKNHLKTVIAWFLGKYGEKVTVDLVETLKQVGFHQATRAGVSLGVDDLKIPPQKKTLLSQASVKMNDVTNAIQTGNLTSVEKSQRLIDTWNQTSETLRQTAVQNFRTTNPVNPVYMMAFSGARGNISQVRQLVAMRGLMADPQGAILEFPIQSNFREGLTVTEYLISCYGARKGLVDTALRTATSGYLTRRLVDAVQHVVVLVTDCQTKKGILIKDKNLEQQLVGRVLFQDLSLNSALIAKKNTLISKNLAKQIAIEYNTITVRSPLTCQTEKSVCQLCYGLDLSQGKLVSLGEAVGIIAAQSIGEPGTQLTMRTFHTGGVGVFSDQAMKSFTAPFEGKIEFLEPLSGLFVRTPHGNIVYLVKQKSFTLNKAILRLTSLSPSQKSSFYEIMHSDIPSGSLLWVKQGEIVKSGQLLLQASRLQTATQEMPESSHPVRASLSGEIFFKSMAIRIVEEEKRLVPKTKKKKAQNGISSQINQKEISPKFPTLIELGNFWVFSTYVQKEEKICQSFFLNGDFLSTETPIQQYNLHIFNNGQLKTLNSSVIFGRNSFEFLFSNIQYSKFFYFLENCNKLTEHILFTYTSNSNYTMFTWYPFFNKFSPQKNGYCTVLKFNSEFGNFKTLDVTENSKLYSPEKHESLKSKALSYIWSQHELFPVKTTATSVFNQKLPIPMDSSEFVVSHSSKHLSNTGTFQFTAHKARIWSLKKRFQQNLIKNEKQNSLRNFQPHLLKSNFSFSHKTVFLRPQFKAIQKKQIWPYIPKNQISEKCPSQLPAILLEPGKKMENLGFTNSYISTNFIHTKNIRILQSKNQKYLLFYSLEDLLAKKTPPLRIFLSSERDVNPDQLKLDPVGNFYRKDSKAFCFYKQNVLFKTRSFVFKIKRKSRISHFLFFQKTSHQIFYTKDFLPEPLFLNKTIPSFISINSPLFTKQSKTIFLKKESIKPSLNLINPQNNGWFPFSGFLKIELKFNKLTSLSKTEEFKQNIFLTKPTLNRSVSPRKQFLREYEKFGVGGFCLFFYQRVKLQNAKQFKFQTFPNGWIVPDLKITDAFLTSKKLGEFRFAQFKQTETAFSLLRDQDTTTVKLPHEEAQTKSLQVGTQVRWGQEVFEAFAIPLSGQIIKTNLNSFTLRKGVPLLASSRGLVHISHNDLVEKNDLLITLRSRRLQTEDIVQGIPKIEQLFEARETQGGEIIQNNMHTLLNNFFSRARKIRPIKEAVQLSLSYIQKFLVENILEAYSNQGVHIAEKHVEVVVRQMTARVRITNGGDTGLLPGELVQLRWVENINMKLGKLNRAQAHYEPVILGITKSVLQSESFLLAASFQQVSKVLVRSALAKKTDFLRGLHENILVGQPIPAGTGIIELEPAEKRQDFFDTTELMPQVNLQSPNFEIGSPETQPKISRELDF